VALLEWDDAWADVLTKRISHRNALHGRCDRSGHGETMEGRVTSLSAWEQQALDSIKDRLASSDPTLVARLTIFTRLASGEEMPAREEIHVGSRGAVRRSRPEPPRRRQRLGLHQAAPMLLWLVTTVALIAVALSSNRGGSQGTCTGSWATFCTGGTSAANSATGVAGTGRSVGRPLSLATCEAMTMAGGTDRKLVLLRYAKSAWPDVPKAPPRP
jgi:Protein of unknown function (DUF3040)